MISNLQLLRYFEVVGKTQHFTRAAQELFISQSTLSKSMDALEQEIGVPLFEKSGRNVQLTRYGEILHSYVQRGTGEMESGLQLIQSMVDAQTGSIRIVSLFTMGHLFLPKVLRAFTAEHPKVNVKYYQKATSAILDSLVSGDVDLGFCGEFPHSGEYTHLSSEVVLTEELCLVVPLGHRLATRTSIDFNEVLNETFVGYNEDTGISLSINRILAQAGIKKKINYSFGVTEDNTVTGLVREGLGVGLISTIPTIYTEGLVKIKITHPYFYRNLYMVWNTERYMSPALSAFRRFVLAQKF